MTVSTSTSPLTAPDAPPRPADAIEVGRVLGAWGVKGGIKVKPFSSDPQALFSSKRWFLEPSEAKLNAADDVVSSELNPQGQSQRRFYLSQPNFSPVAIKGTIIQRKKIQSKQIYD